MTRRAEPVAPVTPKRGGGGVFGCQFQQIVAQFFQDHSRLVARWPLPFLVCPLLLTIAFGVAFSVHFGQINNASFRSGNQLTMFLPEGVQSMKDLKTLSTLFPPKDALRDAYDLFGTSFAYVIVEDASTYRNVLRNEVLGKIGEIHDKVLNVKGYLGQFSARFKELCAHNDHSNICFQHPIIDLLNISNPMRAIQYFLRYPSQKLGNETLDNALIFGSVSLVGTAPEQRILTSGALRIPYVLRIPATLEEYAMLIVWQQNFLRLMFDIQHKYSELNLYYTTSISWATEIERNGKMLLPYMPLLCVALTLYSVWSCISRDWVISKPWLGICGLLNAAFAVTATMGILVTLGYPFLQMVFIMPFLILSISVDNMFLMLNSWRETDRHASVEDRLAKAMAETAVSIMITSLTDGLSFSVGSISIFPAVRAFCTYCAMAILFVFLYQMTFFIACIAITGRREASNRHCISCFKVLPAKECHGRSCMYRVFCTGGVHRSRAIHDSSTAATGNRVSESDKSQMMTKFFSTTFSDFLCVWSVKAFMIFSYFLYVGFATYGLLNLPLGLDLKMLVPRDSHVATELDAGTRHFSAYGGYAYVVTRGFDLRYHDPETMQTLVDLYHQLADSEHTAEGDFWLKDFLQYNTQKKFDNETMFLNKLHRFLLGQKYSRFKNDINFSYEDDTYGQIESSKMLIRMRNIGLKNSSHTARWLRKTFAAYSLPGFIYEPNFVLVDQQESTVQNVAQNMAIAVVVMMLISLLFIPRVLTALWIGASILSINAGVAGGLAMWQVRLDIVTMITMVMSIGFSVDFAAHITYHYLVSRGGERRLHRAMKYVGAPMVQSAVSTAIGVLTLAPIDSYMVRTFVKTVVLVVSLGLLHGLVFLPVFLSVFVPADHYLESLNSYGTRIGTYLGRSVPKYLKTIGNARMRCYFATTTANHEGDQTAADVVESRGSNQSGRQRPPGADDIIPDEEIIRRRPRFGQRSRRHRSFSAADLYDFLKYKTAEQQATSTSSYSEDIYSEPDIARPPPPREMTRSHKLRQSQIIKSAESLTSSAKESDSDTTIPESASQTANTNGSELPLLNSLALRRVSDFRQAAPQQINYRASERPPRPPHATGSEWAHARSSTRVNNRPELPPPRVRRPELPPPPIPPKNRRPPPGQHNRTRNDSTSTPPPPPPPPRSSSRRRRQSSVTPPTSIPSPFSAPTTTTVARSATESPPTTGDTIPIVLGDGEGDKSVVQRSVCRSIAAEAMARVMMQSQDSLIADSDIFGVTQAGPNGRRKSMGRTDLSTFKKREKNEENE